MDQPKTIKIKAPFEGGFAIVNEEDFDADLHERFDKAKAEKAKPDKAGME